MDPRKKLFRAAALEKMASPERLDELMRVTAPAGWLAVLALGVMLLAGIVWGFVGSVPIKVKGNGILMRGEAVQSVFAETQGQLLEMLVEPGDILEAGQVVARVDQQDLVRQIEDRQARLSSMRSEGQRDRASTGSQVAALQRQRQELVARRDSVRGLVERGRMTRSSLLQIESQITDIDSRIANERRRSFGVGSDIERLELEIGSLQERLAEAQTVQTQFPGRVLELQVDAGAVVGPGTPLITVEALEGPIDVVLYVPAKDGKKIREGMPVRVSPSTVRSEEFGFMLGQVKMTSAYPVSERSMQRVLGNSKLAGSLASEGAHFQVVATLNLNEDTVSGYEWSSSGGPPTEVFTGTVCSASVIVETKKPISYVLPIFKETLGI